MDASSSDANASAALLERFQFFEMEHDGQPALIKRVFGIVATDKQLCDKLALAVKKKQQWPKDMAGVLMRLHAAAAAGELRGLSTDHKRRLDAVVGAI